MNAPTLTPINGLITVTAGYTPSTHIHEPDSIYSRHYWVPEIGPLSYLTLVFLSSWLPTDDATITLDYNEFARSLGTTAARLNRTMQRLVGFHLATITITEPATLSIRRRLPTSTHDNSPGSPNGAPPSPPATTSSSTPPPDPPHRDRTRPPATPAASPRPWTDGPRRMVDAGGRTSDRMVDTRPSPAPLESPT